MMGDEGGASPVRRGHYTTPPLARAPGIAFEIAQMCRARGKEWLAC